MRDIWICTRSGIKFHPFAPRAEEIAIEDIAWGLAGKFRFGAQSPVRYTVAQHSIEVSRRVPPEDRLWGLLHDAAEAYLFDAQRPLKQHLGVVAEVEIQMVFDGRPVTPPEGLLTRFPLDFRWFENTILAAVAERFGLPLAIPASVELADDRELARERRDLFGPEQPPWPELTAEPYPEPLEPWLDPAYGTPAFLQRFGELYDANNT
jgi:hypothetical protein